MDTFGIYPINHVGVIRKIPYIALLDCHVSMRALGTLAPDLDPLFIVPRGS